MPLWSGKSTHLKVSERKIHRVCLDILTVPGTDITKLNPMDFSRKVVENRLLSVCFFAFDADVTECGIFVLSFLQPRRG